MSSALRRGDVEQRRRDPAGELRRLQHRQTPEEALRVGGQALIGHGQAGPDADPAVGQLIQALAFITKPGHHLAQGPVRPGGQPRRHDP
ncbi:hypothetical protein [Streptomyces sp. TE33382]